MLRTAMATMAAAAFALTACSSSGSSGSTTPANSVAPGASSSSSSSSTGTAISLQGGVLVGSNGHTLYFNTVDTVSNIKCTGACAEEWPPLNGPATVSGGLNAAKFGTATRPDGSVQATYNGHPLYMFDEDKQAGDKKGDGFKDEGGSWHVAAPAASTGSTGSTVPSGSTSDGGGYTY
jgi:predicted lipoprotein with Yx(FWY)xxD motif